MGMDNGRNHLSVPLVKSFGKKKNEERVVWKPSPDITAYELTLALKVLVAQIASGARAAQLQVGDLPYEARRHFEVVQVER